MLSQEGRSKEELWEKARSLTISLLREGFTEKEIHRIAGVMGQSWAM